MRKTLFAVAAVASSFTGCGGEAGPNLVPVTGTVTINNKPLEGAVVQFVPLPSNKEGQPAEDITGPEGNYKLRTRRRSGVVPGKYHVVVTKLPPAPSGGAADAFKDDPFMAKLSAEGPATAKAKKAGSTTDRIEDEFDEEVPPTGGTIDHDVKARSSASPGTSKSS